MKSIFQRIIKYLPFKKLKKIKKGLVIDKKWVIVKSVGQGGGGSTYTCYNKKDTLKKIFVIKLLNEDNHIRNERVIRFNNEIDTLKRIKSSRVIKCIDSYNNLFLKNKNHRWYVMPEGDSIKSLLEINANKQNGIYNSETLRLILKNILFLFKTLKQLHAQNIYHRDIKPENLISINNRAIFIDFGIAHDNANATDITKKYDKNGLGPKYYSPPEMRRDTVSENIDYSKVDIYSLTKTLWACLTGDYKSFDGQYNKSHTNFLNYKRCSILKEKLNVDLEHLHDFFEINTANEASSRMNIDEAIVKLDVIIFLLFNKTHVGRNFYLHGLEREKYFLFNLFVQRLDIQKINTLDIDMNDIPYDLLEYINIANSLRWSLDFSSINKLKDVVFFNNYIEYNSNREDITNVKLKISNNNIQIIIKTVLDTYIINENT